MTIKKLLLGVGIIALIPLSALSYEVDNFTNREVLVKDSLHVLDQKVNHFIDRAVAESNSESPMHCNPVLLRQAMLRWVRPDPISLFELWATFTDEIQKVKTDVGQSIYRGASFYESPAMWIAGIGRSFLINGHVIGTDKLGHFFMQGHEYYARVQEGADLDHVLQYEHGEDGIYGLSTTGVMSYGDMSANYQGYLFWNRFFKGSNAYVKCDKDRQWVRANSFTWKDYVSDAWDEGINCSEFLPTLGPKVEANLKKIGKSCPVNPDACWNIAHLDKSKFFMSPKCKAIIDERKQKVLGLN